jgi:mono/diheme cytochrome c family protein
MRRTGSMLVVLLSGAALAGLGCNNSPGRPGPEPEVLRPDQVLDFATLYKQNCVACHGSNNQPGAALYLANPVYLAVAGETNLKAVIGNGVTGKLMPSFAQSAGGMLTDQQVDILAKGLISTWGKPGALDSLNPPTYKVMLMPDSAAGQKVFSSNCARCHGDDGQGTDDVKGALLDPAVLALMSDQNLRSIVIAGMNPDMPNFHEQNEDAPLTDQNVTDVVAFLISHRAAGVQAAQSSPISESAKPNAALSKAKHEPSSRQEPNQ